MRWGGQSDDAGLEEIDADLKGMEEEIVRLFAEGDDVNRCNDTGRRRLKYAATINDDVLNEDTDDDYELQYIDIGNVYASGSVEEPVTYKFKDAPSRARRRVRDGDIIISCVRTYLQAIAQIQGPPTNMIVSTGFAVIRPSEGALNARFANYALREPSFLAEIEKRSVGVSYPAINASDLAGISVHLPPLPLQRAIADHLDRETTRLDALVAAKARVLDLLAEKHQSLITRAVTRGLDPSAPLRDSGIPWLGEVPAHWEIWKIGHTASVGNGSTPSRSNPAYWSDGTIPWLNSSVVNQHEVTSADQFVTETAVRECHLPLVESGSVLVAITGQGKTRGQAVVLSLDATINQHLAYVSPDPSRLDPWFLRWTLLSAYGFLRSISDDAGGTKGALTCEEVANIRVPIPPIGEQRAIAASVAKGTATLEKLRTAIERTSALLKERRATLIAAAVTGLINIESAA